MTDPTEDAPDAAGDADEDRLQAFVDGELDADSREAMARRLANDPEAAHRARDYAAQKRRLAEALATAADGPTDPYTATLAEGLARRLAPPPRFRWLRSLGVAAALLAVGWWGHALRGAVDVGPVPNRVADAAQIHELFAGDPDHPVELSAAESDELAGWITRKLGEEVAIPDLRGMGLTFLGGRLLGSEEGPFAQLLYEGRDGSRVSLYLSGEVEQGDDSLRLVEVDGLNAGYWQEDDLAYTLVAEVPPQRLLSIASRLGATVDQL